MKGKKSCCALLLCAAVSLLLLTGCAGKARCALGEGQVCFDERLVLGMAMEDAPKKWELSQDAAYGGVRCAVELEADEEDCLRCVTYSPRGALTEDQLLELVEALERDYGLESVVALPDEGDGPPGMYTLVEGDFRARLSVRRSAGECIVWMSVYRLPAQTAADR